MTPNVFNLRRRLGLSQQAFGSLLGLPSASIYRWENQRNELRSYGRVVCKLLECAIAHHKSAEIVARLQRCNGDQVDVVRTLALLDTKRALAFRKEDS